MSQTPEEREAKSRSAAIDRQLRHDQREYDNTIKILLLGEEWGGRVEVERGEVEREGGDGGRSRGEGGWGVWEGRCDMEAVL